MKSNKESIFKRLKKRWKEYEERYNETMKEAILWEAYFNMEAMDHLILFGKRMLGKK